MRTIPIVLSLSLCMFALGVTDRVRGQSDSRAEFIRANYSKFEYRIPMRDGTRLFTSVYVPNDIDGNDVPILMVRTPYSAGPYGAENYRSSIGPSQAFEESGYIFVYQDVRGRYLSEGTFDNMRPHIDQKSGTQFDESSDTYDTIEWLIQNVPNNNGRIGQWGISYPGFYTSAGCIDSHPALKAVSPQAPIADWFFDDFHRNGAFVLPMAFNFFYSFGRERPEPTTESYPRFEHPTRDGYKFFLDLGPLTNVNKYYFNNEIPFWNDMAAHPNYDKFWQDRNLIPHLRNVTANVLVVGGWYDTEDLYGPLATYAAIESNNPRTKNSIVMGPWYHGQWNRDAGQKLGEADFDFASAEWFREQIQFPFFESHLKENCKFETPEAVMFETGANRWRTFPNWPPTNARPTALHLAEDGGLFLADSRAAEIGEELQGEGGSPTNPKAAFDEFPSDPSKPVPYTEEITSAWAKNYITEDQRFAAWRPDVLVYRLPVQTEDLTIAGPIQVDLWVETNQSDADWIVKVIDEFPGNTNAADPSDYSHRQQLVRAGVLRGRFREGFEQPVAMEPGKPTRIQFELSDICHTFQTGHTLMIQIQSSWFPFIDRNPQKYVENIFEAKESDFVKATHRVYRSKELPSQLTIPVLE